MAFVESRFAAGGRLVEQLDQFTAEFVRSQAEVDRRIDFLAGAQQASLAELLKVIKPATGSAALDYGAHDGAYALPEASLSVIKGWDWLRADLQLGFVSF